MAKMEYFLDGVIAREQVNLVAGSSGSGKTRWIFQLREAMRSQTKLLGYPTEQAIWGYLSGDRAGDSIRETLDKMGINPQEFPIYSCVDQETVGKDLESLWDDACVTMGRHPEFLVVDGFTSFCPQGKINEYTVVAKWLAGLQSFCQREHVTILGAVHTTKAREGQEIKDPRQQIAGSVAWAAYTEGVVVIHQPFHKGDKERFRDIYMCGRNAGKDMILAQFNSQGWLELREGEKEKVTATDLAVGHLLVGGVELQSVDLEAAAREAGVSRSSFYTWLRGMKVSGRLVESGRGKVVVPWEETAVEVVFDGEEEE